MASSGNGKEREYPPSDDAPPESRMGIGRYLATRLSTLKPPMAKAPNPLKVLALLNLQQRLFFLCASIAWSQESFDCFAVSLTMLQLGEEFDKTTLETTWGITLVLMFRSVGAIIFGIASDRYGRKWPLVANNILVIVLELGSGFYNTYKQFLACRALFGIAMGGLYCNAAATALGDCPEQASVASTFTAEASIALRKHWLLFVYLVLLMVGFNFKSHGSQDLYPQILENQFNLSPNAVTVTKVAANLGAMTG
ncbi:MAG: hypothetical protein Q9183_004020 [Haloplaca sp. 2 TL-2023]